MVATRLKYNLDQGTHYIDLARDLSEYHRKLHRQKKIYTVYGGFMRNNASSSAKFNVAPLTWQSKAAVNRGFKLWRKMISHTLQLKDGLRSGKWNDFKIRLTPVLSAQAHAVDQHGSRMSPGEWDYSTLSQPRLIDPDGDGGLEYDADMDQYDLHIVGPNSGIIGNRTTVGLIQSWYDSRPVIDNTGTPTNVPNSLDELSNLFSVEDQDEEKVTIIQSEGDLPPYGINAPYGMLGPATTAYALAPVSVTDNGANPSITPVGNQIHGFQALCGLVQVVVSEDNTEIFVDVESEGESF